MERQLGKVLEISACAIDLDRVDALAQRDVATFLNVHEATLAGPGARTAFRAFGRDQRLVILHEKEQRTR